MPDDGGGVGVSDWEMKDWRVAPRAKYAFAFLGIAVMLSAVILGASMATIPDEGGFDDDHAQLVAENHLSAVEALWVDPPEVVEYHLSNDGLPSGRRLDRVYPTSDPTVRWVVESVFKLETKMKEVEQHSTDYRMEYEDLLDTIDEKFGLVGSDGTYSAWELVLNGTRVHFGSEIVDGPGHIPVDHWTVLHYYSGEVQWWKDRGVIPFRAKLVFHLWFETEEPSF